MRNGKDRGEGLHWDDMTDSEREVARIIRRENIRDGVAVVASLVVFHLAAWICLGLYGISIGSEDDCTRSFKAAVAWIGGGK